MCQPYRAFAAFVVFHILSVTCSLTRTLRFLRSLCTCKSQILAPRVCTLVLFHYNMTKNSRYPGWKCARDARGRNGISRNRAQLRYNAPFLARFRARCEYAILWNLVVYRAMLTNTSGLFCIPLASLRETPRDNRICPRPRCRATIRR